jgi:hypothetical protein
MKALDKLKPKHRLFVEAFYGDSQAAMKIAGYQGTPAYLEKKGNELLCDKLILEAIKERSRYMATTNKAIADRTELQEMWTNIARNEDPHRKPEIDANGIPIPEGNIPLPIRLKATELIGKSEGIFIEKVDMTTTLSLSDLVMQSYKLPEAEEKSIEEIEAEYYRAKEETENEQPQLDELI